VSLVTPETVRKLQRALYAKAKGSADYRFYSLYDKLYRADILEFAYRSCRHNAGAPGVDGQTFDDVLAYGEERWLAELAQSLREKTYRPSPIRRVYIPKSNGKLRPLGIATLRDRVAQTAAMLVLEPIFEADLQSEQYAYRPKRSALDAVQHVHRLLSTGYTEVVDADLSGYFDAIPHAELMTSVARRVSDGALLALLKQWLTVATEEDEGRGRKRRSTPGKDAGRGTPQGSPISPLLSNVYMRRFVLGWKTLGHERRFQAHIVNYADDLVICCKGRAEPAMQAMRVMMTRLKLTVNEEKTRLCRVPADSVDFLGYRIGRCYSRRTGKAFIGTRPSPKSIKRICRTVSELTDRRQLLIDADTQVGRLNRALLGWANYFRLGPVSPAYRALDTHARNRLRRWLCKKHKRRDGGSARYPDVHLHDVLGLARLSTRTQSFPWARA
jgi:group II intron reverse transcriptase/maturase